MTLAVSSLFLIFNWRLFGRTANNGNGAWRDLFYVLLLMLAGTFLHLVFRKERGQGKQNITLCGGILATAFFGITWHFTLDAVYNPAPLNIKLTFTCLSILISSALFVILFLLFHSFRAAAVTGCAFYFIWSTANYYTQLFRGLPMQITDILDVKTAMDVADRFEFKLFGPLVFFFFYLGLICINLFLTKDRVIMANCPLWLNLTMRLFGLIAGICGIWFLGWGSAFEGLNIDINGNVPAASFRNYGTQVAFTCAAREIIISEPEGYSVAQLKEIAQEYPGTPGTDGVRPNIICIMNETFADPSVLGNFTASEEVLPNFKALKERKNTINGNIMISTLGGGTGKTEYEFLTGHSMRMYGAMLSPYVMLGNKLNDTMVATLKNQGYSAVAIHPFTATNYNRDSTYATMGFDDFLDIRDFEKPDKLRNFVTDESCYKKIYELIEETEEPLFTFCVTIQNHGAYNDPNYKPTITLPEIDCPEAEQYLSLLHESDRQIAALTSYLDQCKEPTIICFFGDHFPLLPNNFWKYVTGVSKNQENYQQQQTYYTAPFFLCANFDIGEEDIGTISSSYLGSYCLEKSGVAMTGYQQYLLDLQKKIPGFNAFSYYGADKLYHPFSDNKEAEKLLDTFNCFQYNQLFGGNNKLKEFFRLKAS